MMILCLRLNVLLSEKNTISSMNKKKTIKISIRNLVEFILRSGDLDNRKGSIADKDAMQKGSRLHRKIQKRMGAFYRAEVPLSYTKTYEEFSILIEGRADGIIEEEDSFCVDEIKGVYLDLQHLDEPVAVHLAQAKCYAYIQGHELWKEEDLHESTFFQNEDRIIGIQMTYVHLETEEIRRFREEYSYLELEKWFEDLVDAYYQWAKFSQEWMRMRNASMEELQFPFVYRQGQKEIVRSVYFTIKNKKELFIQAPTGVGKTMSTIYPAVRSVGEGLGEKIFYLTAKTITRTVAEEAFQILRKNGLKYKVLTLTAKEKMCICQEADCNPEKCPRAKGHFDRVNDAVFELLTKGTVYDRDALLAHAEKWNVCPFEMSLDLALWVDAIICDYNYVFDPNAKLQRFFGEGVKGEYIFLIDEAHNLVERGRQMYSAAIYKEDVMAAKRILKHHSKKLERYLEKTNKLMLGYKRSCETYQVLSGVGDVALSLMSVMSELEVFMEQRRKDLVILNEKEEEVLLDFYFEVRSFLSIYELLDDNYVIYSELDEDQKFRIQLFCVNPAVNLHQCMSQGVGCVFFSATLLPIRYYKSLLSMDTDAYAIYAESPFDSKKRGILIGSDVSSKYTRRGYEEYRRIAEYIYRFSSMKKGNYLIFFPSYRFMQDVFDIYRTEFDTKDIDWVLQTPAMGEADRELFLENFGEDNKKTLLGFCVMGGIFSEGIDLTGEKLIGAVIVGTGIPQIGNEREILKKYYDERKKNGFDYAYRYPGMNKVLQSAGRVIRTKEDVGMVLLLDERFLTQEYLQMFPREWKQFEVCGLLNLEGHVREFWMRASENV